MRNIIDEKPTDRIHSHPLYCATFVENDSFDTVVSWKVIEHIPRGIMDIMGALNIYIAEWLLHRHPFFKLYFDRWLDEEYATGGFATLFIKAREA